MIQTVPLLIGAGLVGALHMSAPDHWATLIVLGRISKWSRTRLVGVSVAAAFGHVVLSVALGFTLVALGLAFSRSISIDIAEITGGLMVIGGLSYGIKTLASSLKKDFENDIEREYLEAKRRSARGIGYFAVLGAALSPDLSILPIFLLAVPVGLTLAIDTAIVFALASIITLSVLVAASSFGLEKLFARISPKYNNALVGFVIAAVGVFVIIAG